MPTIAKRPSGHARGGASGSAAQSRSTSAGSSTGRSGVSGTATPLTTQVTHRRTWSAPLPDLGFPVRPEVRNTFIHMPIDESPLLEDFVPLRRVNSSPSVCRGLGLDLGEAPAGAGETPLLTAAELAEAEAESSRSLVLRLVDTLREPELGSAELPTEGSRQHRFGNCKPCAFVHAKGCGNGLACKFCHLCESGEKKRRQKEKLGMRREAHRAEASFHGLMGPWAGTYGGYGGKCAAPPAAAARQPR